MPNLAVLSCRDVSVIFSVMQLSTFPGSRCALRCRMICVTFLMPKTCSPLKEDCKSVLKNTVNPHRSYPGGWKRIFRKGSLFLLCLQGIVAECGQLICWKDFT